MSKLIFVGDPHFRAKGSKYRIDDYYQVQFDKLNQILQLGEQKQVEGIIFLGDIFHTPREPHELVRDLIATFKKYKVKCYAIVGNHDLVGYNLDTLNSSPLGVLIESGVLTLLGGDTQFSNQIVVRGLHYQPDHCDSKCMLGSSYDRYLKVICTHNMILPTEKAPFDFIHPEKLITDANLIFCGHYHMPFDYISNTQPQRPRFVNPGVPFRWTINEAVISPKIVLLSVDWNNGIHTYNIQDIKLQAKPGSEVLDLTTSKELKSTKQGIDNFVDQLEGTYFSSCNLEETITKYGQDNTVEPKVVQELIKRVKKQRGEN